jgi:hypothetical protein
VTPRTRPAPLCTECGTRIDPVAAPVHPSCEPGVSATFRAADRARWLGELGKRRALRSNPKAATIGLDIIRKAARRNLYLEPADVREDLKAANINISKAAGGLWSAAVTAGYVIAEGDTPGSPSAHGKTVKRYRSLIHPDSHSAARGWTA